MFSTIVSPIIPTTNPTQLSRVKFTCKVYAEGSNKRQGEMLDNLIVCMDNLSVC